MSTASKKMNHGLRIIWLVKTSCRQTSLHPGLSTSWCVLACSGWPAFTGFRTTLSPITTCIHMEQGGEPQKVKQGWARPFRLTEDANNWADDDYDYFYFKPGIYPRTFAPLHRQNALALQRWGYPAPPASIIPLRFLPVIIGLTWSR